ncbi:MAG TPA: C1 family peptidase [Bacteroidota bacterium]|nr:C1 family peptidase [Bacteroidota bacterium]
MARSPRRKSTRKAARRKSSSPAAPKTTIRGYGWVPDLPDQRDFLYRSIRVAPPVLPHQVDLRSLCSPVENQGNLGSCTANALAGALEFLELKNKKPLVDLSRLFIYYNERVLEHTVKTDSGAMLRDGIKTLAKQGVCREKIWPYVVSKFAVKPTAKCYKEALTHTITSYHRILTLDEMLECLAEGYPFVFGFTVYESFESSAVAQSGVVQMPQPGERVLGGHAVMAAGYDDAARRIIVRNSWGPDWGMGGYFTMPFDYISDRNLSDDFWTIRAGGQ